MSEPVDDLVPFLNARWDELERMARDVRTLAFRPFPAPEGTADEFMASLPRYVLADIAAKRQILEEHEPHRRVQYFQGKAWPSEPPVFDCAACTDNDEAYPEEWRPRQWPCRTVRLLAQPFTGHPDYRTDWSASSVGAGGGGSG